MFNVIRMMKGMRPIRKKFSHIWRKKNPGPCWPIGFVTRIDKVIGALEQSVPHFEIHQKS